jgi:hypothetical protein
MTVQDLNSHPVAQTETILFPDNLLNLVQFIERLHGCEVIDIEIFNLIPDLLKMFFIVLVSN